MESRERKKQSPKKNENGKQEETKPKETTANGEHLSCDELVRILPLDAGLFRNGAHVVVDELVVGRLLAQPLHELRIDAAVVDALLRKLLAKALDQHQAQLLQLVLAVQVLKWRDEKRKEKERKREERKRKRKRKREREREMRNKG